MAGSFKRVSLVNGIATQLETSGFKQTYDWTKHVAAPSLADLREIAQAEYAGIVDCDFFVFVFPGGKGANVEFGIATALHKPIYVLDTINQIKNPAETSTFYLMDHVHAFHGTVAEFKAFILSRE